MKNVILGIVAFNHDASACIIKNGEILAFMEEERYTKQKNTGVFPENSIKYCLEKAQITANEITDVAFYFNIWGCYKSYFYALWNINSWKNKRFFHQLLWTLNFHMKAFFIKKQLKLPKETKLHFVPHHISHLWYGIYASNKNEGVVLINDSIGEQISSSAQFFKKDTDNSISLKTIILQKDPHSLGYLYGAITEYLHFNRKNGSGKVMALASYGKPAYLPFFTKNITFLKNGKFKISSHLLCWRSYAPKAQRLSSCFLKNFPPPLCKIIIPITPGISLLPYSKLQKISCFINLII